MQDRSCAAQLGKEGPQDLQLTKGYELVDFGGSGECQEEREGYRRRCQCRLDKCLPPARR